MRVTLYTRRDCPLCDRAKASIRASAVAAQIVLEEVDVDGDPALQARFTNDVPVVFVDGREAFRHRVDPQAFAALVRGRLVASAALAAESCAPCRGGVPRLAAEELRALTAELGGGWTVVDEHHLEKSYAFRDFREALAFTNRVGAIAEAEGHHPEIQLGWGHVRLTIWTHAVDGLTRADFVLAAKADR
jgi:4a-hydroxytetrahydrobiopterin dehydratase